MAITDGSTEVKSLAQLGITEINLRPYTTRITLLYAFCSYCAIMRVWSRRQEKRGPITGFGPIIGP